MVVFSPDDRYLLASAVDNEIRQYTCGDGRLHTLFDTPKRNSLHNYTRSYYMNGGEYIIGMFMEEEGRRRRRRGGEGRGGEGRGGGGEEEEEGRRRRGGGRGGGGRRRGRAV